MLSRSAIRSYQHLIVASILTAGAGAAFAQQDDYSQSLYDSSYSGTGSYSAGNGADRGYQAGGAAMPVAGDMGQPDAYPIQPAPPASGEYAFLGPQGHRTVRLQSGAELPIGYETGVIGNGTYTLGRDDVLNVQVRNQPDFSGNFVVGFDGRIQYSYLGDIPVAGLTKFELQQVLEKLLREFVRVPSVTVSIVSYNSKVVYVIGEVGRPGKYVMRGDAIKLREAIIAAGLPTRAAALKRVHVIKPDLDNPDVRVVNLKKILYKGKLKDDIELAPGEIIVVPSTVLAKINDFLGSILSPVSRSQALSATRYGYGY